MTKIFALVDCNNFYASCERVFNPALHNKPVIVLSNNDGCVIARSNEAKDIGIGMGEPLFKCKPLVVRHNVYVYSANFVLYGDMSRRVMNTLSTFSPEMEMYSIDEAFLSLDGLTDDPYRYVKTIRERVKRDTGMPVSVGVAATKTLAKIANRIAKKQRAEGVFCLLEPDVIDQHLKNTSVEDIWGIGREKAIFLKRHGIESAYQLKNATDQFIKKHLTVVSLKTVWELRGVSCVPLDEIQCDKKAIGTSRTFSQEVRGLEGLSEAIASHTANASEKLRSQGSICGHIQVYIATNPFKGAKYYANAASIDITPPTAYSPDLITIAHRLLNRIYKPEYTYKSAGILLSNLQPETADQAYLFNETYKNSPKQRLMNIVDKFNHSTNSGKIFIASEGVQKPCQTKLSKRYTTRWDELLEIKI